MSFSGSFLKSFTNSVSSVENLSLTSFLQAIFEPSFFEKIKIIKDLSTHPQFAPVIPSSIKLTLSHPDKRKLFGADCATIFRKKKGRKDGEEKREGGVEEEWDIHPVFLKMYNYLWDQGEHFTFI